MIVVPLEESQITQESSDPMVGIRGWLALLMVRQYVLVMGASVSLLAALDPTAKPGFVLPSFLVLALMCSVLWLMHQRRRAFVWPFMAQEFYVFLALSITANTDADTIGWALGAIGIVWYVRRSHRCRATFTRTMGELTK